MAINIQNLDIIEIEDDNTDYDPEDIGKFAVQYNGECKSLHNKISDAVFAIAYLVCVDSCMLTIHPDINYSSGRRWIIR